MASRQAHPKVPRIVYGTAYKGDKNTALVEQALRAGFKGIDTASNKNQYREGLVGDAIRNLLNEGHVQRKDLWRSKTKDDLILRKIQTKFSPFREGKDPVNYPQDVTADIETQVRQTVASSLKNLGASGNMDANEESNYLDNVMLHAMYKSTEDTLRAYRALEAFVPHKIRTLGVSNFDLSTLRTVYESVTVKPILVQNHFTEKTDQSLPAYIPLPAYDADVRRYCREHDIVYQPWGVIWGNPTLLASDLVAEVGREIGIGQEEAWYLCIMGLGKISMTNGTKRLQAMKKDLASLDTFDRWITNPDNSKKWSKWIMTLEETIDEAAEESRS